MVQMCMTDLESTMKKGKNLFGILVTLCMVGGLLLPGCVPKSMDDEILNNMKISMDQEILGARDFGYGQVSVNETGIFYFDAGVMSYYDYEMDEKYVLCSTPQCRHNSIECNAYMGDEEVYGGYAMYDGYVYVLYRSSESEYLELARMDTAGQNKEIVSKIYAGVDIKEWRPCMIEEVYYHQGYAYVKLQWLRSEGDPDGIWQTLDGYQLLAIDLSNGNVTELTGILTYEIDALQINYDLFTDGQVVFSVEYPDEIKLTMEQYYEQNPAGDYWQYYDEYWGRMSMYMEYKTFYPKTRQIEVISEGAMRFMGEGEHQRPFYLSGVYDGKWLAANYDEIGFIYYWYDPSNRELEEFLRTDKENRLLGRYYGEAVDLVYDGDKLLGGEYLDEKRDQQYYIDLKTGERHDLFVEDRARWEVDGFQILEETSEYLIGRSNGGGHVYYVVKKSDFEESYMEKVRKVTL